MINNKILKLKNKRVREKKLQTGLSKIVNKIAQKSGSSSRLEYLVDLMVAVNIL